jgi:hypothetical protein
MVSLSLERWSYVCFNLHVMSIVARLGDLQGSRSDGIIPLKSWSGVVGTVSIVVINNRLGVAVTTRVATTGSSSWSCSWCLVRWSRGVRNWRSRDLRGGCYVDRGGGGRGWLALALPLPPPEGGSGGGSWSRSILEDRGVDIGDLSDGEGALLDRDSVGQGRESDYDN